MLTDERRQLIISRCSKVLMALLGSEELVKQWWDSPNRAFDGETPLKTLDSNPESVIRYIISQLSGEYL